MKYVPNGLTIMRMCLVPVFAYLFFAPIVNNHIYALAVFLLAGFTDFLDGYLARKYSVISVVGIVLDPLADKLMLLTALACLTAIGVMPAWALWIMIISESIQIVAGTYIYVRRRDEVIPANKFGKSATVLFIGAVFLMVVYPAGLATRLLLVLALLAKVVSFTSYGLNLLQRRAGKGTGGGTR